MVYAGRLGSHPATIGVKYLAQWFRTARIIRREQPDVIFVMTPPLFAALPAFWYAWRRGARVVIDAHTCAFVLPRWTRLQALQLACCRWARTTFVTNEHLASIIRKAGAHATIVPDVPVIFEDTTPFDLAGHFTIAVICSFDSDEPVDAILEAAAAVPDVRFVITGDHAVLGASVKEALPTNVQLTGFLSTSEYGGLLTSAHAVLDLTTLDHTMLRGAYEAVYQGLPVIVSNWPLLRAEFPIAALHVDNSSASIAAAVRELQANYPAMKAEALQLRTSKARRWQRVRTDIIATVLGRSTDGLAVPPQLAGTDGA